MQQLGQGIFLFLGDERNWEARKCRRVLRGAEVHEGSTQRKKETTLKYICLLLTHVIVVVDDKRMISSFRGREMAEN